MRTVDLTQAGLWLARRWGGDNAPIGSIVTEDGMPEGLDEPATVLLAACLLARAEALPARTARYWIPFEADAAVEIHRTIQPSPEACASRGFWAWLTLAHFTDLVAVRHPKTVAATVAAPDDPGDEDSSEPVAALSQLGNYGLTGRWEGLLFRLWSRGDYGYDPEFDPADPYYHARLGPGDMWRSHILRVDHGGCRELSRAFLRRSYDERLFPGRTLPIKVVRDVAKRLRRRHAVTALELMGRAEAEALVERIVAESQAALGSEA